MYLSFYDLTFYQLPGVMLSFVFSFLIFYFIYYRINFSKNIYVRLLQKFVVFNLCFIVPILLASLLDLYLKSFLSDGNIKDFINIIANSPSDSYGIKLTKTPTDMLINVANNITTNIGAASAGGMVGAAVIKNLALPPVQRAATAVIAAGATSGAVTLGIQGGKVIAMNLNNSSVIKNHPYGNPDVTRVPSPEPSIINSPLENGNDSIPLVDLLQSLVSLNFLEIIVLLLIIKPKAIIIKNVFKFVIEYCII